MDRRRFVAAGALVAALAPRMASAQSCDVEMERYRGAFTTITSMMAWSLDEFGRVSQEATDSATYDAEWQMDVISPFAVSRAAQDALGGLTVPPRMSETHFLFARAIDEYVLAGDALKLAVLTIDESAIASANQHIENANALVGQANDALTAAG